MYTVLLVACQARAALLTEAIRRASELSALLDADLVVRYDAHNTDPGASWSQGVRLSGRSVVVRVEDDVDYDARTVAWHVKLAPEGVTFLAPYAVTLRDDHTQREASIAALQMAKEADEPAHADETDNGLFYATRFASGGVVVHRADLSELEPDFTNPRSQSVQANNFDRVLLSGTLRLGVRAWRPYTYSASYVDTPSVLRNPAYHGDGYSEERDYRR